MRITLIQDIIHWAAKAENLLKAENQIASLSGKTDLVVLPEMFSTGFCIDKLDLAEEMSHDTVTNLKYWAQKFNLAITGSFIAKEDSKIYNRGFFVFPNGEIKIADKRHLFSMGGEDNYFSAGNKKLIVNYCGFNICLLICYDLRFPVWARNIQNEYDLLIYVANFPEKRISNWDILLKARAVENQAYVCGLNRIGIDGLGINYNGHSTLLDYNAVQLLNFPENEFSIQTYDLQLDNLNKFRKKFAFWRDADIFGVEV
jgi:omega-amidase